MCVCVVCLRINLTNRLTKENTCLRVHLVSIDRPNVLTAENNASLAPEGSLCVRACCGAVCAVCLKRNSANLMDQRLYVLYNILSV